MDSLQPTRPNGSLVLAVLACAIGAVAWAVATVRREAPTRVAWAPLWPRPDGSVRSFGEVWDHPETTDTPAA